MKRIFDTTNMEDEVDLFGFCAAILFWAVVFISLVGCDNNPQQPTYIRSNKPCDVVIGFEKCCGVFADRYVLTNKNRYRINETDNIVVGDSICRYNWSDTSRISSRLGVKNKDIFISEY